MQSTYEAAWTSPPKEIMREAASDPRLQAGGPCLSSSICRPALTLLSLAQMKMSGGLVAGRKLAALDTGVGLLQLSFQGWT